VLGPNGTGKTSLLKVLLGQLPLSAGTATVAGRRVEAGSERIGYVPQHRSVERGLSMRGQDLVGLGLRRPPVGRGEPATRRPVGQT
jgi:zinc/manganese transport system ATP-binding protein